MRLFTSAQEFYWYKAKLNLDNEYVYNHVGMPKRYPCKVDSEVLFGHDPKTYNHTFYYEQKAKCSECGHETMVWPKVDIED